MKLEDLNISDVITGTATFPEGRFEVAGEIINITANDIVIIDDGERLVGLVAEDVAEIVDFDRDVLREDGFRSDVEADADALGNVYGSDETPLGEELDGGSDLGNDDY